MNRRNFLKTTSALGLATFASPLFAKDAFTIYGAPALPSVTIGTAALMGELGKEADVSLKIWRNPDQLRAGVASGEFKVMMSPSNVGVNLRNQGANVGLVNILSSGLNALVTKAPLARLEDLYGKKLVMPFKNDLPDIVLRALFKKLGLDISRVDITYTATPPETMASFLSMDFDAAMLLEPLTSACLLKGKKIGVAVERAEVDMLALWGEAFGLKPFIPQAGIIADVDFYRANEAKFETFNNDLKNALEWMKKNPESAGEIGSNYLPAPAKAIAMSISKANLVVMKPSQIREELAKFYEIVLDLNPRLLGGKMPDKDFYLC